MRPDADRELTPDLKAEIVLARLRGDRAPRDVCRDCEDRQDDVLRLDEHLRTGSEERGAAAGFGLPIDLVHWPRRNAVLSMEILDPAKGVRPLQLEVEQRWDRLTEAETG